MQGFVKAKGETEITAQQQQKELHSQNIQREIQLIYKLYVCAMYTRFN